MRPACERLSDDHQVLDIDGRRAFAYSTTYFDTSDLRCFVDHIEDRRPRFKARSRLYEDTGECVFEVKLKRSEDETDKRQIDYPKEQRRGLTEDAMGCLKSALADAGLEAPEELEATLTTEFESVTLAALDGSERLTCDFGICLVGQDGNSVHMHQDLILIETKSEDGQSTADRELERMPVETISVSKYRAGHEPGRERPAIRSAPRTDLFS
ncbi:MAG: VTC domain-containing protein [Solirubrobacteraceae bacterium]